MDLFEQSDFDSWTDVANQAGVPRGTISEWRKPIEGTVTIAKPERLKQLVDTLAPDGRGIAAWNRIFVSANSALQQEIERLNWLNDLADQFDSPFFDVAHQMVLGHLWMRHAMEHGDPLGLEPTDHACECYKLARLALEHVYGAAHTPLGVVLSRLIDDLNEQGRH